LARTALTGLVLLGIGNGCLSFAEQWIPSGMAALFVTTQPFWLVGIESLAPKGERLHGPTLLGMLVGLAGVGLLVAPAGWDPAMRGRLLAGFLVLQLGCAGWSLGSIAQRHHESGAHPIVAGAVQQLAVGVLYLALALAIGGRPASLPARGVAAVLYLSVFGSIVGYSAYLYVLHHLPIAVTTIYTYINPVVAVLLGWLFYREPFGWREAGAMAVIFCGVALVKRFGHRPPEADPA
jgi:drug/metabolite transporter (DMT)-like permease